MTARTNVTDADVDLMRGIGAGKVRHRKGSDFMNGKTVSQRVASLVARGLAQAGPALSDGREITWLYQLTDSGWALVNPPTEAEADR